MLSGRLDNTSDRLHNLDQVDLLDGSVRLDRQTGSCIPLRDCRSNSACEVVVFVVPKPCLSHSFYLGKCDAH